MQSFSQIYLAIPEKTPFILNWRHSFSTGGNVNYRAVIVCRERRQSSKKGEEGEIASNLGASSEYSCMADPTELQSVTTAISVLKQHVTQPNVKMSDWKKLQGSLQQLQY